jgi:hypothetical protein
MRSDLTIRPLLLGDLPALARFNEAFSPDSARSSMWEARMEHWWPQNPAFNEEWTLGMLLENSGEIVGCIVGIPLRILIDGQIKLGALRGTWRVQQPSRSHSLALAMALDARYADFPSLNGTASENAFTICPALGYSRLRAQLPLSIVVAGWLHLIANKLGCLSPPAGLPRLVANGAGA